MVADGTIRPLIRIFRLEYCSQDASDFYTIDYDNTSKQDLVNYCALEQPDYYFYYVQQDTSRYCPQNTNRFYEIYLYTEQQDTANYCPQDANNFYLLNHDGSPKQDTTNYCPQNIANSYLIEGLIGYCPQNNNGFYDFNFNSNPTQDLVSYCPQDTANFYNFNTAP